MLKKKHFSTFCEDMLTDLNFYLKPLVYETTYMTNKPYFAMNVFSWNVDGFDVRKNSTEKMCDLLVIITNELQQKNS